MSARPELSSNASNRSRDSLTAGSGDFSKSVSFLELPKVGSAGGGGDGANLSPFVFASSPASLTTPIPAASADTAPSFFQRSEAVQPISDAKTAAPAADTDDAPSFFDVKPWPTSSDDTMELDEKPSVRGEVGFPSPELDHRFNRHRGSISHSIASTEPEMFRRSSVDSNRDSSEIMPAEEYAHFPLLRYYPANIIQHESGDWSRHHCHEVFRSSSNAITS